MPVRRFEGASHLDNVPWTLSHVDVMIYSLFTLLSFDG